MAQKIMNKELASIRIKIELQCNTFAAAHIAYQISDHALGWSEKKIQHKIVEYAGLFKIRAYNPITENV